MLQLLSSNRPARGIVIAFGVALLTLAMAQTTSAKAVREQLPESANPTGRLFISPGRIEQDVEPGVRRTIPITLTNDSPDPFDVTLRTTDLGQAPNPRSVATQVEDGEFGAGDWLSTDVEDFRLAGFEQITFDLIVDPPVDAPTGTNLAGLVVDSTPGEGPIGTKDSDSIFRIEGLIQVFLTVPGPVKHDLRITGVDVRDALVTGGQRFVVWDVKFANDGTVNEHVNGKFVVKSIFGNAAYSERIAQQLVLRGGTRTVRIVWRDLPWVGLFTPNVQVRGDDAKRITATGERVIVFPWWLPLAIGAAIVVPPLFLWWRRRREWRMYLEDEDADEEADEEWVGA